MKVKLELKSADISRLLKKSRQAVDDALYVVAGNAEMDTRDYVPRDTSALQDSAVVKAGNGVATIGWGGTERVDYARVQYYGDFLEHDNGNPEQNPLACPYWFEASAKDNLDRWRGMFARLLKGGL